MRTSVSAPAGGIHLLSAIGPERATEIRASSHWLVPDLALLVATFTLFYSLFLFGGYHAFFHDSDAGWHIRTGETILESGALPRLDLFSFTQAGKPWFAWEWLADVAVGAVHQAYGISGVALFYSTVLGAAVWLWFQLTWAAGGNFLLAAAFSVPMLSATNLHWLARPHLLSWIFLLVTVRFAIRPDFSAKTFAAIAAVSCLWANVHASFFLGPAILLIYAAGAALNGLLFEAEETGNGIPETRSQVRGYCVAALVALVATVLNPYGIALHQHVILYLMDGALLDRVGEFQSFNFHLAGSFQILIALALAGIGSAACIARKKLGSFLLISFLVVMGLRSARGLPLIALLALPIANGAITEVLRSAKGLKSSFRKFLYEALNYSDRLRGIDRAFSGLLWAPLVICLAASVLRIPAIAAGAGFPPAEFPVAASAEVAKLPVESRILASDKFGGYLIYRFAGTRKVFFDGRSDLYGAPFLAQYACLMQLRPGWQSTLEQYGFTHALLPADAPLIAALESTGWTPLYHDSVATLLARNVRN